MKHINGPVFIEAGRTDLPPYLTLATYQSVPPVLISLETDIQPTLHPTLHRLYDGTNLMKMIAAFIRPKKWSAVQEALSQIEVDRMTVADILGYADTSDADVKSFPKQLTQFVFVEIIVNDDFLERTIEMMIRIARTGTDGLSGDGKIFILPVDDTVRVHDGSHGFGAV